MSTHEEINILINKFENAVQNAWIYDTKLEFDESYSPAKLNKADLLYEEAKAAKKALVDAVGRICKKSIEDSWIRNPDRMGGQFTQDEIDESSRGGHGW
jgi:hypothetical protein